ncbi:polysaccharide biosynthesis protein [Sedimentibacter sp. zth1]|uniref:polysaccharide biosynthesis protein n=1 Tax=Sedimentibacter sp. zth1 TaxID=2816908 RepID=UPI001A9162DF|nr:nucleoside-diphosphate sugar epimerase/dehydratase [Sedimentibacter sp. zth1]QSX05291.1 polysaccharide biosynthesis protein [Sedimentibacter sp. zth1]
MSNIYHSVYNFLNKNRKVVLVFIDSLIAIITYLSPFVMSGMYTENAATVKFGFFVQHFWIYTIIYIVTFVIMGVYKNIWRYAGIQEIYLCLKASIVGNIAFIIISFVFGLHVRYYVYFVIFPVSTLGTTAIRIIYRAALTIKNNDKYNHSDIKNILIIGAGDATVSILNEIKHNNPNNYRVSCIVDDDKTKIGRCIDGIKVVNNTGQIQNMVTKFNIKEIILSIPSINKENKKRILDICATTKCKLKIVPDLSTVLNNDVNTDIMNNIRDVQVEDLLGRDPITLDDGITKEYIKDKVVLVTGGGGSIGSELCRQIASYEPTKLIVLDIYENNAYDIQQELIRKYGAELNLDVQIASVRDINKLEQIFSSESIDIVFHAAAHKHVPLMENNPEEAIKNNVIGTFNVASVANNHNVDKFVLISTDKAVNPTNVMGATKRIAELIIQTFDKSSSTDYVAVRFGNVLGSNGSVIPLFINQIKEGGPVTITHPEITRFFMTIPEAVQLVLRAGSMANGGEIFVLDMGQPVKIKDLAYNLISLSGLEPNVDIEVTYTGLRPGEKLYEELLIGKDKGQTKTDIDKIYIEKPMTINNVKLIENLNLLKKASYNMDLEQEIEIIQILVPTYESKIKVQLANA